MATCTRPLSSGQGPGLYEIILQLRRRTAGGQYFIPFRSLKHALTKSIVVQCLKNQGIADHRVPAMADIIVDQGLRVFAILALLRQERLIQDFIGHQELDSRLPMEKEQIQRVSPSVSPQFFEETQWELCPHMFRKGPHRVIKPQEILPFVDFENIGEGAGGEIYKCGIACEQQSLFPEAEYKATPVSVIRKRIKLVSRRKETARDARAAAYRRELECLELLRHLRHGNIIELLASYEYQDEYYLLFPVLPMDLSTFLAREDRYGMFKQNTTFYTALSELCSAVEVIHNINISKENLLVEKIGYHHDIRPKNILVTESTFVLTDFGLSRFKMPEEGSETLWRETIGDYIAPECMAEDYTRLNVGRSIDIWSLGCLLTEMAVYMELGPEGVNQFQESRRETSVPLLIGDSRFFEGSKLRHSVNMWLSRLTTSPIDRTIRSLIACSRLMLQVKVELRPTASVIASRLQYIAAQAAWREIMRLLDSLEANPAFTTSLERLEIQFQRELLTAWGTLLGMDSDRCFHGYFDNKKGTLDGVAKLVQQFRDYLRALSGETDVGRLSPTKSNTEWDCSLSQVNETIRGHVQGLWDKVPPHYQKRMEQLWRLKALSHQDDVHLLDEIENISSTAWSPAPDIGVHAALRRLTLEFERQGTAAGPRQKKLLLNPIQVDKRVSLDRAHEIGIFEPVDSKERPFRVVIEWALYSPSWAGQTDEEKILKLLSLAELLSQNKPTSFHVLDCIGVLPPAPMFQHEGFAFVYNYPQATAADPQSLEKLLVKKDFQILLEHKFGIAQTLATSILELHSTGIGWLHKNLKSASVLFFPQKPAPTTSEEIGKPYLIGFQHSRPNGEIWYSDLDEFDNSSSESRDPRYIPGKVQFRPEFDFYSLGIILLEIGFWQPIKAFRFQHRDLPSEAFRKVLVEKYVPKLGMKMGSRYRDVVLTCLDGPRIPLPVKDKTVAMSDREVAPADDATSFPTTDKHEGTFINGAERYGEKCFWEIVDPLCQINLT